VALHSDLGLIFVHSDFLVLICILVISHQSFSQITITAVTVASFGDLRHSCDFASLPRRLSAPSSLRLSCLTVSSSRSSILPPPLPTRSQPAPIAMHACPNIKPLQMTMPARHIMYAPRLPSHTYSICLTCHFQDSF